MFNFDVILAGRDMVTDVGRATMCRRKCKTLRFQTKVWKMKDLSKTWVLTENSLMVQDNKRNRKIVLDLPEKPSRTQGP